MAVIAALKPAKRFTQAFHEAKSVNAPMNQERAPCTCPNAEATCISVPSWMALEK